MYKVVVSAEGYAYIVHNNVAICVFGSRSKGPEQAANICDLLNKQGEANV